MRKKEERLRLKKLWKLLRQSLILFLKEKNQVHLHQFRVQVKKTKSLLMLLSTDKKNRSLLEIFKPMRKIFHQAGRIRDAHLHMKLAVELKLKDGAFIEEETSSMNAEMEDFINHGKKNLLTMERTFKKLRNQVKSCESSKMITFLKQELDAVVLALAKRDFDESMHNCRKKIKNILYTHKLVPSFSKLMPLNVSYLGKVQDVIGDWHDSVLAAELLEKRISERSRSLSRLKSRIGKMENALISVSDNFWQQVTVKANVV